MAQGPKLTYTVAIRSNIGGFMINQGGFTINPGGFDDKSRLFYDNQAVKDFL